jgi:hypothetical protein
MGGQGSGPTSRGGGQGSRSKSQNHPYPLLSRTQLSSCTLNPFEGLCQIVKGTKEEKEGRNKNYFFNIKKRFYPFNLARQIIFEPHSAIKSVPMPPVFCILLAPFCASNFHRPVFFTMLSPLTIPLTSNPSIHMKQTYRPYNTHFLSCT